MPLPDEIVEDILLRLAEASDVARASAVCAAFRRAATAPRFLRRFRSLHPRRCSESSSHPAATSRRSCTPSRRTGPPRPRAPSRRPPTSPSPSSPGTPTASVAPAGAPGTPSTAASSSPRAVATPAPPSRTSPLHRRYVRIPPVPGDLVPSNPHLDFEHFLAPSSSAEDELTSFQVICNVRSSDEVVTLAFSSVAANWRRAASISLPNRLFARRRHYVRGCFYWASQSVNYMLVLDPRDMKLTVVKIQLPQGIGTGLGVVDAGQGKLGIAMVGIPDDNRGRVDLYSKTWRHTGDDGGGTKDWEHRVIHSPELGNDWNMRIRGAFEGYLLLEVIRHGCQIPDHVYYVLEMKTLVFERLRVFSMGNHPACFYASFPPPLSLPTI